ncbi:MAG: SRPBCC family protein [Burkholderiaceae bacterium]|nr:SRPBCC family protein [Burkholderiaceae bacterium]
MPERETRFVVNASPAEVWKFVRDVHALCSCIPGVEKVTLLDERTADLTVKEKVGVVPLIVQLKARIDAEDPPHRLHAVATADHLTMEIDVGLKPDGTRTELLGLIRVKGEGPLRPVVNSLFDKRADERAAQFAEQLERRFGAVGAVGAEVVAETTPEELARERGWLAQVGEWLRRLWQRLQARSASPGK